MYACMYVLTILCVCENGNYRSGDEQPAAPWCGPQQGQVFIVIIIIKGLGLWATATTTTPHQEKPQHNCVGQHQPLRPHVVVVVVGNCYCC